MFKDREIRRLEEKHAMFGLTENEIQLLIILREEDAKEKNIDWLFSRII